jgi:hypothetical protein
MCEKNRDRGSEIETPTPTSNSKRRWGWEKPPKFKLLLISQKRYDEGSD